VRRYQVATAAVIMVIAAVAMFDSRADWLPEDVAGVPGGLGAGFYPFWAAALVFLSGLVVIQRTLVTPQAKAGPFTSRADVLVVLRVVVPMVVATVLLVWLGFYIVTAAYVAFFMWYIGRYAVWWDAAAGLTLAVIFYMIFERVFLVSLPKSIFYGGVLPF
jgi:hypothetical protein